MKLVKEHINEKFTEDSDPIYDMGIGRKFQIEQWLEEMKIYNYVINSDFTIDVIGNVDISFEKKNLKKFPKYIQFNRVDGFFSMAGNEFITLKGCPKTVGSWFGCHDNYLISLEYAPIRIHISLYCDKNPHLSMKEIIKYAKNPKVDPDIWIYSNYGEYQVSQLRERTDYD